MEKYLDHEFETGEYTNLLFCKTCKFPDWIIKKLAVTCAEIKVKSDSHKWVSGIYQILANCEVCGIIGIKSTKFFTTVQLDNFYTCNEYLMVRANE